MSGVEGALVTGILKATSGLTDALLAPKLERLKKWSSERELSKILGSSKIDLILKDYLIRTIQKTAELSTIVFPQTKLKLSAVYEPLTLHEVETSYQTQFDHAEQKKIEIDVDLDGKCYLIIDEAGMGKSTFLKYLALEVISKTDRIPILFELSTYNKGYSLLENIAKSLDELNKPFDRALLNNLIVAGKFVIILDAFDELSGSLQVELKNQFTELSEKKGKSILIISSRPQDNFPNLIQPIRVKIEKLTANQAQSLVLKYDAVANLDVGERLINEFSQIPKRFLETPLLVGLLYRTFGFNNSIAKKVSVFYGEIFDALYKGHDLTKSGYVREKTSGLDIDTFRSLLRSFSFLYILDPAGTHTYDSIVKIINNALSLNLVKLSSSRHFLDDLLLAVPLLTRDGNNIKFMHRTIAEYFAAEFIINSDNSSSLIKKILSNNSINSFRQTLEYVYEIAPTIYNEVITKPIAESFIKKYEGKGYSTIYSHVAFQDKCFISYWPYEDVVTDELDGSSDINFPNKPENVYSFNYGYGEFNGVRYVACLASSNNRNRFSESALREISEPHDLSKQIEELWKFDDVKMEELVTNLKPNYWHSIHSKTISKLSHCESIINLLMRSDTIVYRKHRDRVKIMSFKKSHELIKSVEDLSEAQKALNLLLS